MKYPLGTKCFIYYNKQVGYTKAKVVNVYDTNGFQDVEGYTSFQLLPYGKQYFRVPDNDLKGIIPVTKISEILYG